METIYNIGHIVPNLPEREAICVLPHKDMVQVAKWLKPLEARIKERYEFYKDIHESGYATSLQDDMYYQKEEELSKIQTITSILDHENK